MGQHFRGRLRQTAVILVLAVAGVGAISGTSQAAPSHDNRHYTAGAPGSGDAYFPFAGNGGYDVLHYDLALRYTPPTNPAVLAGRLSGVATVTVRAKQNLESLNFDLRGLGVTSVQVDGKAAKWSQVQNDADRNWELTAPWQGAQIHQPSLFIAGSKDGVITGLIGAKLINEMERVLPNLRQKLILDGAGHWIQQERPDEVNAALIAFLKN